MKHLRFIAVLLVSVMVIGAVQPALAYSRNTAQDIARETANTKAKGTTVEKLGRYGGYAMDGYNVCSEIWNGNYSSAAKEATKVVAKRAVVTPAATVAAGSIVTTLGFTGILASGGTALIIYGAGWGVSKVIDWLW